MSAGCSGLPHGRRGHHLGRVAAVVLERHLRALKSALLLLLLGDATLGCSEGQHTKDSTQMRDSTLRCGTDAGQDTDGAAAACYAG